MKPIIEKVPQTVVVDKIVGYESVDGVVFPTKKDCEKYEYAYETLKSLELNKTICEILKYNEQFYIFCKIGSLEHFEQLKERLIENSDCVSVDGCDCYVGEGVYFFYEKVDSHKYSQFVLNNCEVEKGYLESRIKDIQSIQEQLSN